MSGFSLCPVCQKERETKGKRGGLVMTDHRRWDGKQMVHCAGSGKPPKPFSVRGT